MVVPRKTHSYIRYSFLLHKEVFLLSLPEGLRIKYTAKFIKMHGELYIKTKTYGAIDEFPYMCNKRQEYVNTYAQYATKNGIYEYLYAICQKENTYTLYAKKKQE